MKLTAPILALALVTGCASVGNQVRSLSAEPARSVGTPAAPATPWSAPASAMPAAVSDHKSLLPAGIAPGSQLSLTDIVDIALSNNPATRISWLQARAAEAQLGSAESEYLPEIDLSAQLARQRTGSSELQTTYGPSAALNYLLFDFGGRAARVQQARQSLIAANFLHNQTIQDVVLRTEQAYYDYLDAKALLAAQDSSLKERQAALDSAEARHRAGVATIADVLQARTALSQAQLTRETIEGNLHTIEGILATTMGLPATTQFDFGTLPADLPVAETNAAVDQLIASAIAERPDLAAARAAAVRAEARVREVRSQGLPTVGLSSGISRTFFGTGNSSAVTSPSAAISLRFPLFTGFRNTWDLRAAETNAALARESSFSVEQQIGLQVWSAYYAMQTAGQRLATARDLLASAQQSADVASNRYRAGVGSILDLLTAEAALESARAQEVQSRADWLVAVAQLAHATGRLGPAAPQGK